MFLPIEDIYSAELVTEWKMFIIFFLVIKRTVHHRNECLLMEGSSSQATEPSCYVLFQKISDVLTVRLLTSRNILKQACIVRTMLHYHVHVECIFTFDKRPAIIVLATEQHNFQRQLCLAWSYTGSRYQYLHPSFQKKSISYGTLKPIPLKMVWFKTLQKYLKNIIFEMLRGNSSVLNVTRPNSGTLLPSPWQSSHGM